MTVSAVLCLDEIGSLHPAAEVSEWPTGGVVNAGVGAINRAGAGRESAWNGRGACVRTKWGARRGNAVTGEATRRGLKEKTARACDWARPGRLFGEVLILARVYEARVASIFRTSEALS